MAAPPDVEPEPGKQPRDPAAAEEQDLEAAADVALELGSELLGCAAWSPDCSQVDCSLTDCSPGDLHLVDCDPGCL